MRRWAEYRIVLGSGGRLLGFTVELDGAQLSISPHGYCGRAHRFLLSELKCVEPWREDLRQDPGMDEHGQRLQPSVRLHVQFHDGTGQLFGPWATSNAQDDFDRLRVILGSLFCGDSHLEDLAVDEA
jgi:hypothetical protein